MTEEHLHARLSGIEASLREIAKKLDITVRLEERLEALTRRVTVLEDAVATADGKATAALPLVKVAGWAVGVLGTVAAAVLVGLMMGGGS